METGCASCVYIGGRTEKARVSGETGAMQRNSQQQTGNSSLWSVSSSIDAIHSEASSPASPASSAQGVERGRSWRCTLDSLPLSFLQQVLVNSGSAAGSAIQASRALRTAWRSVMADPHLAAQWLHQRYGPVNALDALAGVPMERYVRGSILAASASRVMILGVLVVRGCRLRLTPEPAAVLLYDACVAGNAHAVQLVLGCGKPPKDAVQKALLAAVERSQHECLHHLICTAEADPTANDSLALRIASGAGSLPCVQQLLAPVQPARQGVGSSQSPRQISQNPPAQATLGTPPVHSFPSMAWSLAQAALGGHTAIQEALLKASPSPSALATQALIWVATSGGSDNSAMGTAPSAPAAIRALLAAGADAAAYDNSALMGACQRPTAGPAADAATAAVVRELILGGADARAGDSSALLAACRVGASEQVVAALLQSGAEAGAHESAALRLACKRGATAVVSVLLAAPRGAHSLFGLSTAVAEACVAGHCGLVDACVAACERHGVEPQAVRDLALIQVAQAGCLNAAQLLLVGGAQAASCGCKALISAAEAGHEAVVAALLAAGADPGARDGAPLAAAALRGHTGCVRELLSAGADPCARDSWALWVASEAGHMDIVTELMAAGADPVGQDSDLELSALGDLLDDMQCDD